VPAANRNGMVVADAAVAFTPAAWGSTTRVMRTLLCQE
jgi:hypothetical protein